MINTPAANYSAISRKQPPRRLLTKKAVLLFLICLLALSWLGPTRLEAASLNLSLDGEEGALGPLELLVFLALLTVAPSLLLMMTSFTRIVITFSFLRNAMGLQQTPPNQVIIGLALFLSLFIMMPVLGEINDTAVQPYLAGEIDQAACLDNMQGPLKIFMLKQTKAPELNLFLSLAGDTTLSQGVDTETLTGLGMEIVIPAFITSELKRAFTIGFLLFLPFLVIDLIVASTLMSMGMMMLPPSMISLPFKLMLFVVVDGWSVLVETLVKSFN